MNVFFEEDGSFKVAFIMTESQGSMQIESAGGKRSKIKTSNVLMRFEASLTGFMEAANLEAEALDLDFLWECCGEPEFGFEAFAEDYYGRKPTSVEAAAIAIKLHSAPVYFNRKGKGRYKAAPAEILKAALAGLEKKRLLAEKMAGFIAQLKAHTMPEELMQKLDMLLYEPDKNAFEYKTLDAAAGDLHVSHIKLLHTCGAIPSIHDYHLGAFLREYFAKGTDFTADQIAEIPADLTFDLPIADVEAFSIDDSTTTEIDDALSIKQMADGVTRVGIHISAPALGISIDSPLDIGAMQRLSTVYMPGHKITMLPETAIRPFSLDAGKIKPVLSLYLHVAADFTITQRNSKVELIKIADNLRHDALEPFFNEATLAEDSGHPYWAKLIFLFQLAQSLEKARGKYDPTKPPQVDYNFYVDDGIVSIVGRHRGSPMDKLVAELMIEANNQWGALLAAHEVPGLYRAQMGGKVYMTTKAEPHQGLGVAQYAWSTSPLRRAVDLINQRQIISVVQNTAPAYLLNSDALTTHLRNFELTYKAYSEFQIRMERYWCLQYLVQEGYQKEGGQEIHATVWRENLVRLDKLPYMTKVYGLPELKTGTRVSLQVQEVDTLMMDLRTKFMHVIESEPTAVNMITPDDENEAEAA
ncbi:MAG: RNB domain-containing ribonuclease [Methylotenera sp.]|nr:RNB domain-containing ribonuclease [Methylotenera sp.]MDP2102507.1 RNB domain-containing ribonuclease [Methylotenera sp.]MDP2280212.1 RNB domain-containing ribonuclease [Methylotenera sp.]MDP2402619.1 RNB domain-containing ribonuclease [Methylotenera sp.]MDP3059196.1 RNB domain-containing ribonuclease [Methylotenera sp.]